MPAKIDFKKTMKEFYQPCPKQVVMVDVPEMQEELNYILNS